MKTERKFKAEEWKASQLLSSIQSNQRMMRTPGSWSWEAFLLWNPARWCISTGIRKTGSGKLSLLYIKKRCRWQCRNGTRSWSAIILQHGIPFINAPLSGLLIPASKMWYQTIFPQYWMLHRSKRSTATARHPGTCITNISNQRPAARPSAFHPPVRPMPPGVWTSWSKPGQSSCNYK